jgi:hypothetical protein
MYKYNNTRIVENATQYTNLRREIIAHSSNLYGARNMEG